jgi:Acyl-CoA carboxylase epsilon subunit
VSGETADGGRRTAEGGGDADATPAWRIVVRPEPTEDELAAVVAALAVLSGEPPAASPEQNPAERGRWAAAGRREALRGLAGGPASGWGRTVRDT